MKFPSVNSATFIDFKEFSLTQVHIADIALHIDK